MTRSAQTEADARHAHELVQGTLVSPLPSSAFSHPPSPPWNPKDERATPLLLSCESCGREAREFGQGGGRRPGQCRRSAFDPRLWHGG